MTMTDRATVRIVIGFLGVGFLGCLAGGFYLAAAAVEVPEFLIGLGGTALGALASLLARTGTETQTVSIEQPRDQPVPVVEDADHMP